MCSQQNFEINVIKMFFFSFSESMMFADLPTSMSEWALYLHNDTCDDSDSTASCITDIYYDLCDEPMYSAELTGCDVGCHDVTGSHCNDVRGGILIEGFHANSDSCISMCSEDGGCCTQEEVQMDSRHKSYHITTASDICVTEGNHIKPDTCLYSEEGFNFRNPLQNETHTALDRYRHIAAFSACGFDPDMLYEPRC